MTQGGVAACSTGYLRVVLTLLYANMSEQIVPGGIIDQVMRLFVHLDLPSRYTSDLIYMKLKNATTPSDVVKLWSLFHNESRSCEAKMYGYCVKICALLQSIDGFPAGIQHVNPKRVNQPASDRLVAMEESSRATGAVDYAHVHQTVSDRLVAAVMSSLYSGR